MQCENVYSRYFYGKVEHIRDGAHSDCVFRRREPTLLIFVIYAFVLPSVSLFGLCANFINAIVFMRPKMSPSAFTYLAALSWLDCLSCLFICLTALARSIFFYSSFWLAYDLQWQTPLFGITTGAANLVLACVSLDRLVYLWRGLPNGTPRLCRRVVAKRMIIGVIFVSCVVNFPYFFVFVVNKDGSFQTTNFYHSHYYKIHNWFSFILLAILPAILLLLGNAAILIAFRRWTKQSKKCQKQCNSNNKKRYQHQMKLTITILIVITLYLIGELPAHLTSRKSALNLLFSGDVTKVDFEVMERLELICMTLNALQLSMNILVYALINPSFVPEFFVCLRGASDTCFRYICCPSLFGFCKLRCCWTNQSKKVDNNAAENIGESNCWSAPSTPKTEIHHENQLNQRKVDLSSDKRSNSCGSLEIGNRSFDYENEILVLKMNLKPKRHSMPNYIGV